MFWSRPFISDDIAEWIDACFAWFDAQFSPVPVPVLPTRAYFTAGKGKDIETARVLLADVCRHLGVDRPIMLFPLGRVAAEYRHSYQTLSEVEGTFQQIDGTAVISYDPEQMAAPIRFLNTLAHEVMHVKLADRVDEVPGGAEAHELATDLGCIICGFGVFQLQAADDAGWSGYLSQPSRAYALARFLKQRGLGAEAVSPYLSLRTNKLLHRALKLV